MEYSSFSQRLRDLEDNIARETNLLRQYEQLSTYANDPRDLEKITKIEIPRQKKAITSYEKELAELKAQLQRRLPNQPPAQILDESAQMQHVESELQHLNSKANMLLLKGQLKEEFHDLYDLLIKGDWKKANAETQNLILSKSGKEHLRELDTRTIKRLPCDDLLTINELWIQSSERKFGFSAQKEIYKDCLMFGVLDYNCFGKRVGWKSNKGWHVYLDNYKTIPEGHFPKPPQFFNRKNTLIGCFIPPLAISFILFIFLCKFHQPVIIPILALLIGFLIALFSFITHTSSYLEGLEWITCLENCESLKSSNEPV